MDHLRRISQPLSEQKPVQRVEHQALGPARSPRQQTHVLRAQAPLAQAGRGARAGMHLESLHRLGIPDEIALT